MYCDRFSVLLSQWESRLHNSDCDSAYKEALSECAYELKTVINEAIMDNMGQEDFPIDDLDVLLAAQADDYLASMEADDVRFS